MKDESTPRGFLELLLRCSRIALIVCSSLASPAFAQTVLPVPTGLWDGTIQSRAGEVTFGVEIQKQSDGKLQATLLNGTDRQPFSSASWNDTDGTLALRMNYYDGVLTLHSVYKRAEDRLMTLGHMDGEYTRLTSKGLVHIAVSLVAHQEVAPGKPWSGASLAGDWIFTWPSESGAEKTTRASFQQQKDADANYRVPVSGTIQPVSGDTGLLHGFVSIGPDDKARFHLSRFDGIHVMAIDGEFESDGSLKGQQGGIKALEPFTARRAQDAKTADPNALAETLTHVKDPSEPFRFSGLDSSGQTLDQDSPQFKGKPLIVDIFGTWCPNCHDEAPVLEKLYQKYHNEGLEIVGLAYEYVDDTDRNLRQIAIYRDKFAITFPLLLSGTTDQGQIAKTLPQLVGFGAFPTSIFIDRDGHVRQILAGFTGPSTGEKYQEVQQRMDELVREIVAK
ncbi:MAG TPA: TlpA disulfide reductase family protein [Bryocella sp.]|nr:TlpA disulfide reductase family protein [Bryocella sp.]